MANKVIMVGNLTRDPELKTLGSGSQVAEFSLALNRKFTSGTEKKEETTFVDVTVWGKQAEILAQYAKKGRQLYVEGRLTQDTWEDNEGNKRSKLKVTAENFEFIGSAEKSGGEAAAPAGKAKASQPAVVDVEEDNDIPF